jgi:cytochrome c-type biogenesis protein CcmH/NrfF
VTHRPGRTRQPGHTRLQTRVAALALLSATLLALAPQAGARLVPQVSLPLIERQAMCVTCKVALNESQSPQAVLEKEYIKELIAKGDSEAEIKHALVAQYGPTVLGMPSAHGFELAVYLVPATVVLALVGTVMLLLPRWRRRARNARERRASTVAKLSPADSARLETDLARFD